MTRGSDSGAQKMEGTTTHSAKMNLLEAGTTVILQQNWRDGRRLVKRRGGIGRTRELMGDYFLRGTFAFPIKTILKISVPPLLGRA